MNKETEKSLLKMIEEKDMNFNLAINDVSLCAINSDYHRTTMDVIENLECIKLLPSERLEIWKAEDCIFSSAYVYSDDLDEVLELFKKEQEKIDG